MLLISVFAFSPVTPNYVSVAEAQSIHINSDTSETSLKTTFESTVSAIADSATSISVGGVALKELTWDWIAWALAKMILKGITNSILNWINSGFQGSPAFITDLDGFLLDLADQVAGEFIYGTQLGFLCSPFELDVRIALALQYQTSRDYQPVCTLSDVTDNIEGFISGSFDQGGLPAWFELTQSPSSNPTGAYLEAQSKMDVAIRTAQGREISILEGNDFFLNFEICDEAHSSEGNKENCQTSTPGHVIAEQLNEQLSIGGRTLVEADEFNEIIGALFAQVAQQALTGAAGLLGLGGSSYSSRSFGSGGNLSYLEAVAEEGSGVVQEQARRGGTPLAQDIANEQDYIALQSTVISKVDQVEEELEEAREEHRVVDPETGTSRIQCFDLTLPTRLARHRVNAEDAIPEAEINIARLQILDLRMQQAVSAQEQLAISDEYAQLQSSGTLTSITEKAEAETFIALEIDREINDFRDRIEAERRGCSDDNGE